MPPVEDRLEERIERARFLGEGGRGGVSREGERVEGGRWCRWYHWDESEKRVASVLRRDMVGWWWMMGFGRTCKGVHSQHDDFLFGHFSIPGISGKRLWVSWASRSTTRRALLLPSSWTEI